jgi:cytochrome c
MRLIAFAIAGLVAGTALGDAASAAAQTPVAQSPEYKRGKVLFNQCRACHDLKSGAPPNAAGPNLSGIFGRKAGSGDGYKYSPAMRAARFNWDTASMDRFLKKPSELLPGNVMAFSGVADAQSRAALIAYLQVETAVSK